MNRRFQPHQILEIVIHQIANKHIKTYYYFVYGLTRSNPRSFVIPLCPMLAETFSILFSSLHTDFPICFTCCYWSLYQYKKTTFRFCCIFFHLYHYTHLVLLTYNGIVCFNPVAQFLSMLYIVISTIEVC